MKSIFLFVSLLLIQISFAQPPATYYFSATGTGYALKTQLYNIIKDHSDRNYDGLYVTYQTSDRDYYYENDGTILDMYSENPAGKDPYTYTAGSTQRCGNYSVEGDCYNREHIIPQSVFNSNSPMVSDAHFITPTDGKVNGLRSNFPHGNVSSSSSTTLNGGKLGPSGVSGYTGTVFEPIDEFKGDIARMYFYFATRYENTVASYSYNMFNDTSGQVFTTAFLTMLYKWHTQDPVNAREIARNNAIYARQNNRNPYIDNPEWVQKVWGAVLSKDAFDYKLSDVLVYPNPTKSSKINIETETGLDKIQLVNINGQIVQKIDYPKEKQKIYTLENLKRGVYFLKLYANDKSITKKIIVN